MGMFQRLVYAMWLLRKQWGFRDSEEEEKDTVVQSGSMSHIICLKV